MAMDGVTRRADFCWKRTEGLNIDCLCLSPSVEQSLLSFVVLNGKTFHLTYRQRAESLSTKAARGSLKFGGCSSVHDTGNLG